MKRTIINELNTIQKLEVELGFLFIMVIIGSYIFSTTEHISYFDSVYFSIITLASIGYGDIVPHTTIGKVIAMCYAMVGLPLFITMGYMISSLFLAPIKTTKKRILKTQHKHQENNNT